MNSVWEIVSSPALLSNIEPSAMMMLVVGSIFVVYGLYEFIPFIASEGGDGMMLLRIFWLPMVISPLLIAGSFALALGIGAHDGYNGVMAGVWLGLGLAISISIPSALLSLGVGHTYKDEIESAYWSRLTDRKDRKLRDKLPWFTEFEALIEKDWRAAKELVGADLKPKFGKTDFAVLAIVLAIVVLVLGSAGGILLLPGALLALALGSGLFVTTLALGKLFLVLTQSMVRVLRPMLQSLHVRLPEAAYSFALKLPQFLLLFLIGHIAALLVKPLFAEALTEVLKSTGWQQLVQRGMSSPLVKLNFIGAVLGFAFLGAIYATAIVDGMASKREIKDDDEEIDVHAITPDSTDAYELLHFSAVQQTALFAGLITGLGLLPAVFAPGGQEIWQPLALLPATWATLLQASLAGLIVACLGFAIQRVAERAQRIFLSVLGVVLASLGLVALLTLSSEKHHFVTLRVIPSSTSERD